MLVFVPPFINMFERATVTWQDLCKGDKTNTVKKLEIKKPLRIYMVRYLFIIAFQLYSSSENFVIQVSVFSEVIPPP